MTCSRASRSASSTILLAAARRLPATLILMLILLLALAIAFASGCGSRTVFVPEESPMRIGPDSRMRVYHRVAGEWTLSENRIAIPEGWYLVPPSYVRPE